MSHGWIVHSTNPSLVPPNSFPEVGRSAYLYRQTNKKRPWRINKAGCGPVRGLHGLYHDDFFVTLISLHELLGGEDSLERCGHGWLPPRSHEKAA